MESLPYVLSLQIHQIMMPLRRYCEVQNNRYIILAQIYLSFQQREVFSRSGGRGRREGHNHSWWRPHQPGDWGDCEE